MNEGLPHPIDVALGERVRHVREQHDITREVLAQECGVSSTQLAKYELGQNRITFSRLVDIARALRVTLAEIVNPILPPELLTGGFLAYLIGSPETVELVQMFNAMSETRRKIVISLIRNLAKSELRSAPEHRPATEIAATVQAPDEAPGED